MILDYGSYGIFFFMGNAGLISSTVGIPCRSCDPSDGVEAMLMYSLTEAPTVNPKKLEAGLRTNSAGITYTLLLRIEATGFPTFGHLL